MEGESRPVVVDVVDNEVAVFGGEDMVDDIIPPPVDGVWWWFIWSYSLVVVRVKGGGSGPRVKRLVLLVLYGWLDDDGGEDEDGEDEELEELDWEEDGDEARDELLLFDVVAIICGLYDADRWTF